MNDEDTKPIRNYRNERCVFCGTKTVILFHLLRWCPDCEKKEKEKEGFEWPKPEDDESGMFTKELQKFRDWFKVSRCRLHNVINCDLLTCRT